ncbi:dTDP-fucopyranose mutase [Elasticomyces elasticus]|uniref:dTDP-fucopyranose mutase n=1 Tax=Exophiala sideris TaxID=1016849 RepID=A0ABR0JLJ8_9EURO|nr:dTDP-fucopyranose mutase [Elasticomyces elasticus]KAK5036455.1 dTDP-fucopyranose mutase [Exophiala sideris]KAK5041716.1 dTDP-fucopyranose mutase [Exophiala sideris]KAK5066838.1 dTDP-fucopyranose mutase [Exophiala sideris]KAK5184897.1 dTDP-fucopyranose mutase [Eurotiomycetes sp. CCFEE 6388]
MAGPLLSDAEIDRLLDEAENRLREKAASVTTTSPDAISFDTGGEAKPRKPFPKLQHSLAKAAYIQDNQGVAQTNPQAIVGKNGNISASAELKPTVPQAKSKKTNDQVSAGPDWFDLPKTNLTPQLKRDLQLIEMRSVLDPHRHYKKNNRKGKIPTFSQTGTVIEGPTEYYSARINKRDRANNFVEEAMATEKETGRFKRKYAEIQEAKTSGKKAHYKKLMAKRKKRP